MRKPTINSVSATALNVKLDEPFEIASGKKHNIENVFVKVTLEDQTEGYGEASPLEPINGENQETVIATVRSLSSFLKGKSPDEFDEISDGMKSLFWAQTSARAAVEIALLDALLKTRNGSLWDYYGGAEQSICTDYTISIVTPDEAFRQAKQLAERGFEAIKTKVGTDGARDLERLKAVSEAAPDCSINIDANEGFTAREAIDFAHKLESEGVNIDLFEQPVKRYDLEGLKQVTEKINIPVAADESVFFPSDARRIADMKAADAINIKLMKSGLKEGEEIARISKEAGLDLMVGCMLESALGMTASVMFAAGLGGFRYVDLDPREEVYKAPFSGGAKLRGNCYHDLDGVRPGLGIRVTEQ